MRLSAQMRRSVAVSLDTQLLPGTRVSWHGDRGRVKEVELAFDGKTLEVTGVFVTFGREHESFGVNEFGQLEVLP